MLRVLGFRVLVFMVAGFSGKLGPDIYWGDGRE